VSEPKVTSFSIVASADLPPVQDGAGRNAIDTDERPILFRFVFMRPRASGVSEVHLRRVKATYDIFIGKEAEVIEAIHRHHRPSIGERKISAGGLPFGGLLV